MAMAHLAATPLLIPSQDSSGTSYSGFLDILFRIHIGIPHQGGLSQARVECEWKLQQIIQNKLDLIQQRLGNAKNISSFLKEFVLIAESCVRSLQTEPGVWSQDSGQILHQIQELGWDSLVNIDDNFSVVELGRHDEGGRWHKLKVTFNKQDTTAAPVCVTDLPEKFDFHWSGQTRLKHVFQQFEAAVNSYQEFWNMMKEIDENCWVLEPEQPTFACTQRRIALGANMSLHITVNSRQPSTLPECRFLGAESATAELREKLNTNLHRWDVERSLLKNLQEVLDVDFPSPTDTRKEELSVDCGICYCHNLSGEIPDVVCEDKRCAQAFHRCCLYEWLRNLSARQSFNTLFGECPFCSHPIRVKMPAG